MSQQERKRHRQSSPLLTQTGGCLGIQRCCYCSTSSPPANESGWSCSLWRRQKLNDRKCPRVCSLQVNETQMQPSGGGGTAPHQGDGHSAAVRHACSNQMTAASTETLAAGAASNPETSHDHNTGVCARTCQTSPAVRTGSGHPSNLALNLGCYSEEEKQDQSKDEPPLELHQQEGCEGKEQCCVLVNLHSFCSWHWTCCLSQLWSQWWTCSM